jgi:hypothetical protein
MSNTFETDLKKLERSCKIGADAYANDHSVLIRRDKRFYNIGILATLGVLFTGAFSILPIYEKVPRMKFIFLGISSMVSTLVGIDYIVSMCPTRIELSRIYHNKYVSLQSRTESFRTLRMSTLKDIEISDAIDKLNDEKIAIDIDAPTLGDKISLDIMMSDFENKDL